MSGVRMLALAFVAIAFVSQLPSANADLIDDIKELKVFELRRSSLACPVIVVGQNCPEENPLFYFKCCGDLNANCCFRLQDWVVVVLAIMAVCIVLSILVNFIRCLFCY